MSVWLVPATTWCALFVDSDNISFCVVVEEAWLRVTLTGAAASVSRPGGR
jgi:hypothetical protein